MEEVLFLMIVALSSRRVVDSAGRDGDGVFAAFV